MEATAIEIKYTAGKGKKTYRTCKTLITDKGIIRTTFERAMHHSRRVPMIETYEYRISPEAVKEKILSAFGWAVLQAEDAPVRGQAYWQLTVYTNGKKIRLKGATQPVLFGSRLADAVMSLVRFKREPILFDNVM